MQALVTGGAQGIGYKIVESLINDGFSITIFDINPETCLLYTSDAADD